MSPNQVDGFSGGRGTDIADIVACFEQPAAIPTVADGQDLVPTAMNAAGRTLMGNPTLGRPLRDTPTASLNREVYRRVAEALVSGRAWHATETLFLALDPHGRPYEVYLDMRCGPTRNAGGEIRGATLEARDVTDSVLARRAVHGGPRGLVLQAALLPVALPLLPRTELAATYLPAEPDTAAGDWFDTIVRPDGSLALVVGDVIGSGVAASATMSQLRAVLGHCLGDGAAPDAAMAELDRFARRLPAARAATVGIAELRPETGMLSYCTAGHPPPLVLAGDGVGHRYLTVAGGGPLGTGSGYRTATDQLSDDQLLLLYTDGVIARPGCIPAQAALQLAQTAAGLHLSGEPPDGRRATAQRVCDQTVELLTGATGHSDDVILLGARPRPPIGPLRLTMPGAPLAVPASRTGLEAWLTALHAAPGDIAALLHAVGEIVTNAVEHAYGEGPEDGDTVTLLAELTPTGRVEVTVADHGRWKPHLHAPYRGFGLSLAGELVDDLTIDRAATGTTVHLGRSVSRPASILAPSTPPSLLPHRDDEPHLAALTSSDDPEAILVVSGPIDAVTAPRLREQLRSVTGNGTISRTVDLAGVTVLSSAGVHVLYEARDRSSTHHEDLQLHAPPGSAAHHVLGLVGLAPTPRPPRPFGRSTVFPDPPRG